MAVPKKVIKTGKLLQAVHPKLAANFAEKLFTTPIKHHTPKRELEMLENSIIEDVFIHKLNTTIKVYRYGNGSKKALLCHGWSGRGTQLVTIANALLKEDYTVISFDAPAHGKSEGKYTHMRQFIDCILQLSEQEGAFDFCVGHSLGGMALLNAINRGVKSKKLVTIGSANIIENIITEFVKAIALKPKVANLLQQSLEQKFGETVHPYSSYIVAQGITIPVMVVHDKNDKDVPVRCAEEIRQNLKNGTVLITEKLGHRKILGDQDVIEKIIAFSKT